MFPLDTFTVQKFRQSAKKGPSKVTEKIHSCQIRSDRPIELNVSLEASWPLTKHIVFRGCYTDPTRLRTLPCCNDDL
jgi:hypothetical protein